MSTVLSIKVFVFKVGRVLVEDARTPLFIYGPRRFRTAIVVDRAFDLIYF